MIRWLASGAGGASRRRFLWIQRLVVVLLLGAGAFAALYQDEQLWRLDALVIDNFQKAKPRDYDPSLPVRIVSIDTESLERFGQWPWPRPYFGEIVRQLSALGAAAIAFDVLFAEPDRTSPELFGAAGRSLDGATPGPWSNLDHTRHDVEFSQALEGAPVALAAVPNAAKTSTEALQRKYGLAIAGGDPRPRMQTVAGLDAALPILVGNAAGYGVAGVGIESGAVVRRLPVFQVAGGEVAPSLAMEALRIAQQAGGYVLRSSDAGEGGGGAEPVLVDARNGAIVMPVAADGAVWIRYAGPQAARFVPFWRVLQGDVSDPLLRAQIEGQIIIVAATAPGLGQPLSTPMGAALPAEIYAEVLEQALTEVTLQRPDWAPPAEAVALVVLGLLTALATFRRSALLGAVVALLAVAATVATAWYAFDELGLVLAPLTPATTVVLVYVVLTTLNYIQTARETGAVRSQFERFVAPEVIRELVEDPDKHLSMEGVERELTVMFTDARGFTTLSETMSPDELIAYLNACLSRLSECVLNNAGTIDKYMGDCIMAFWNAPLPNPDHIDAALRAIKEMHAASLELAEAFEAEGKPRVDFGFGLNTGECHVGLMGSERRLEYSCVGDHVNLASRLEGLTKDFGVWNIVSQDVASGAPGWSFAPLGPVQVRGRAHETRIMTMLGAPGETLDPANQALLDALNAVDAAAPEDKADALADVRKVAIADVDVEALADAIERRLPATEAMPAIP